MHENCKSVHSCRRQQQPGYDVVSEGKGRHSGQLQQKAKVAARVRLLAFDSDQASQVCLWLSILFFFFEAEVEVKVEAIFSFTVYTHIQCEEKLDSVEFRVVI